MTDFMDLKTRELRKLAEDGDPGAQYELGVRLVTGDKVIPDEEEGIRWIRSSAEQGNLEAAQNLGICYQFGNGVERDLQKAMDWYDKASDLDYSEAAYEYLEKVMAAIDGNEKALKYVMSVDNETVDEAYTYEQLAKVFLNEAHNGVKGAMLAIAECFQKGCGVPESKYAAEEWRRRAGNVRTGHLQSLRCLIGRL